RTSDGRVLSTVSLGAQPQGLAFDGAKLWVGLRTSNRVAKVRTSDGAILGTYTLAGTPSNVAFDGTNVWVTLGLANSVQVLIAAVGSIVGTFPCRTTHRQFIRRDKHAGRLRRCCEKAAAQRRRSFDHFSCRLRPDWRSGFQRFQHVVRSPLRRHGGQASEL